MNAQSHTPVAVRAPGNGPAIPSADETQQAFTVEDVVSEAALARLAPDWQGLSVRSDSALLFNSFEWVCACWKHFHQAQAAHHRAELWVLAVRDTTSLRAVVPLWVETRQVLGVRTRIARFLGEGPSDYGDLLLAPPRSAVLDAVVTHLAAHSERWDLLELREFFGESLNLHELTESMIIHGWWIHRSRDSRCESIPTEDGWDVYYHRRISAKRRKDLRREWRNLEAMGTITKELITDVRALPELVDAFAGIQAVHVAAGEHRPGEFNDPLFRPFLEHLLTTASARGWLRLAVLRADGLPVAYWLAFLYRGRYYLYNTAHRADCQRFGAGKLLMLHMLEQFFAEAGGVIDYLRGAEPYKGIWTERSLVNIRLRAAHPGLRGLIGRLLWFDLMPALQRRASLLYRLLILVSDEGFKGLASRVLRRRRSEAP